MPPMARIETRSTSNVVRILGDDDQLYVLEAPMGRQLIILLATGLFYIQGHAMAAGKLVEEVLALDKPERFRPRQIDDIAKRYVALGISKDIAKKILTGEGFKISEEGLKKPLEDCLDCDGAVLVARYDHKPALSLVYDFGVVIEVGFRGGSVAVVHGWYVKSAY
jgi:hypothetical protein